MMYLKSFLITVPTITLSMTGPEKLESGLSWFLVFTVFCMFGPNLAGAIEGAVGESAPYRSYKLFSGICYLTGGLLLLGLKLSINRNPFKKI